jgi:hypothetical protein
MYKYILLITILLPNLALADYIIPIGMTNGSPADLQQTYFGYPSNNGVTTSANCSNIQVYIPIAGTVTQIKFHQYISGGLGTNENASTSLSLNCGTLTSLSTTMDYSTASRNVIVNATNLNIPVVVGDYVSIKWMAPTWATNPTTINAYGFIYISASSSSSSATVVVDIPNLDIWLIIILFWIIFFGMIFYFRTPSHIIR